MVLASRPLLLPANPTKRTVIDDWRVDIKLALSIRLLPTEALILVRAKAAALKHAISARVGHGRAISPASCYAEIFMPACGRGVGLDFSVSDAVGSVSTCQDSSVHTGRIG